MNSRLNMLFALSLLISSSVIAKRPEFIIEIRNHLFFPAELVVPSDIKFRLVIINHDQTPEEFDSFELNREKVIFGGQKATIYVGPLRAGSYHFFGEFNPSSATGKIIAVPKTSEVTDAD